MEEKDVVTDQWKSNTMVTKLELQSKKPTVKKTNTVNPMSIGDKTNVPNVI